MFEKNTSENLPTWPEIIEAIKTKALEGLPRPSRSGGENRTEHPRQPSRRPRAEATATYEVAVPNVPLHSPGSNRILSLTHSKYEG